MKPSCEHHVGFCKGGDIYCLLLKFISQYMVKIDFGIWELFVLHVLGKEDSIKKTSQISLKLFHKKWMT